MIKRARVCVCVSVCLCVCLCVCVCVCVGDGKWLPGLNCSGPNSSEAHFILQSSKESGCGHPPLRIHLKTHPHLPSLPSPSPPTNTPAPFVVFFWMQFLNKSFAPKSLSQRLFLRNLFFFTLRYNWHTTLYSFQVYSRYIICIYCEMITIISLVSREFDSTIED